MVGLWAVIIWYESVREVFDGFLYGAGADCDKKY